MEKRRAREKETRNRKLKPLFDVGVLLSGKTLFRKKNHVTPVISSTRLPTRSTDVDFIARSVPSPASHPAS